MVTAAVSARRSIEGVRRTGVAGMASGAVIAAAVLIAVIGPAVAPHDPTTSALSNAWIGPLQIDGHLLGFDGSGRDLLSRLLAGARSSMLGPLVVVALSMVVGVTMATLAAWRGGLVDSFLSSASDILFSFPGILLAVLATAVFGAGLPAAVMALAVAYTPYVARVLRGAALRERSRPYIAALEVQGASGWSICLRHLVPNLGPLIVAQATTLFGYAMVDLAAISFLGLGVQPPAPDWGSMVNENQQGVLQGYPLPALLAGLGIVVVVVAFNVLGERLYEQAEGGP